MAKTFLDTIARSFATICTGLPGLTPVVGQMPPSILMT